MAHRPGSGTFETIMRAPEPIPLHLSTRVSRAVGYGAHAWLVGDTLVDSGFPHAGAALERAIGDRRVARVLLTHAHEDHCGNAARLAASRGAEILGPTEGLGILGDPGRLRLRPYQRAIWGRPAPVAADPLPDEVPTEHGVLAVIPTPGHSPDHVVFFDRERRRVYAGDLFLGVKVRAARPFENVTDLLASLRRVRALEPEVLYCTHRGVVRDAAAALDAKIAFLQDLHDAARRLRDEGVPAKRAARRLLGRDPALLWLVTAGDFSGANLIRACWKEPGRDYRVAGSIDYDPD